MKKSELIEVTAAGAETTKATAKRVIEVALDAICDAVAAGDEVRIAGFGTFRASPRAARIARHPLTGEPFEIAAGNVPRFTAGPGFKAVVSGKKNRLSCQPDLYVRQLMALLNNTRGKREAKPRASFKAMKAFKQRCRDSEPIHGLLSDIDKVERPPTAHELAV